MDISNRIDRYEVNASSVRRARLITLGFIALVIVSFVSHDESLFQGLKASAEFLGAFTLVLCALRGFTPFARAIRSSESRPVFLTKKIILLVWKTVHDAIFASYETIRMYDNGSCEGMSGKDLSYFSAYGVAMDDISHVDQRWV